MRVIGKKSSDPIIGVMLGAIILVSAIVGMIFAGDNSYALIIPEVVGVIIIFIYGVPLFSLPRNIILYDEEKMELTVYRNKTEKYTIMLSELEHMQKDSSGIRRNYTGIISFSGKERFILARYIANATEVAEEIEKLKIEADKKTEEKLSVFAN